MCWASPNLASDQEGRAKQQMARRSGMQEVSGLDAAHKDDQTYGKENPVQNMKWSIIFAVWAQFRLTLEKTLVLARWQVPFVSYEKRMKKHSCFLENDSVVWHRKMKMRSIKRVSCCSHSLFQTRPPVEDSSVPSWKNPVKPDLFGRLQEVKNGTWEQTPNTLARGCCTHRLYVIAPPCVSISI